MKLHCCVTVCVCMHCSHTYLSKNRQSGLAFSSGTTLAKLWLHHHVCDSQGRPVSTGEGHSFVGFCLFVKRIGETAPGAGVASVNLALHLCPDYCAFLGVCVWFVYLNTLHSC